MKQIITLKIPKSVRIPLNNLNWQFKPFLALLFLIAITFSSYAQIESAQTGNWFSSTTWVGGVVPTAADDVVINANHNVTTTAISNFNSLIINIDGTFTVFENATISGGSSAGIANYGNLIFTVGGANRTQTLNSNITNKSTGIININGGLLTSTINGTTITNEAGEINLNVTYILLQNIDIINKIGGHVNKNNANLTFPGVFTNEAGGTLTIGSAGSLTFTNSLINSGNIDVAGTMTLQGGSHTFNSGNSFGGSGVLNLFGENTITANSGFVPNFATVNLGVVNNVGIMNLNAGANTEMILPASTSFTSNENAQINNFTNITNNGNMLFTFGGSNRIQYLNSNITNTSTGIITMVGNSRLTSSVPGTTITNEGVINLNLVLFNYQNIDLVNKAGGNINKDLANLNISSKVINESGGTITVKSGSSLTLTGLSTNNGLVANNGIFTNTGTMDGIGNFTGNIVNNNISTLDSGPLSGCMTFDNDVSILGNLIIEVGGKTTPCTEFDQLIVLGSATLGGKISINFSPFNKTQGDVITIIDASSVSGTFSTLDPALPSDWEILYNFPNSGEVSLRYNGPTDVTSITTYTTVQDGNWEDASTWLNGDIPPSTIPDGTTVEIKHQVILNSSTVVTNDGRINVSPDNAPVAAPGDYFNPYYQFQIYGTLNNNNILEVIPGPSQILGYYSINYYGTLNNTGTIKVNSFNEGPQGYIRFVGSGTLNNESGGLIEIYDVVQFGGTVNNKLGATYRQFTSVQGQTFGEFNNAGLFDIVGGSFSPRNGGELNNLATGVIENNASIYLGFYVGNLNNEGVLNNRANAKLFINGEEAYYDGTLNSPNGTILNDGKIIGIGSFITSAGTLSGSGVIYPYNALPYNYPGYSLIQPGILDVTGNLTNFGGLNYALQNTTIGEGYGSVSVTGLTDISGTTLEVTLQLDAITNQVGDEYILLESTEGVTGQFSTTTLPTLDNNLKFEVNYESNRVILKVVSIIIDTDGDGINDDVDNCPDTANADQADNDGDGLGDICDEDDDNDGILDVDDICPLIANADQADNDGDGIGDVCDDDDDNDGILDVNDNCPLTANADQVDNDLDGIGDICDDDDDNDGILDVNDNCPITANADQLDSDGDGVGDVCDVCPLDADNDIDGDGVCGDIDNCPTEANPDQADSDCDGVGDVCDVCPGGDDSVDNNNDGIPDCSQLLAYEDYIDAWKCGKKNQKKITIWHIPPGHPENAHEICISYNALPAHIANHGDIVGPYQLCNNFSAKSAAVKVKDFESFDSFNVNVYPNPASNNFNIKVIGENKLDKVEIQVIDITGKRVISNTFDSNLTYKFGEKLQAGIYFVKIAQGEFNKTIKVIKQ